ncbi:unnamed protein product [Rotaria sp. Silwood1]|nr:unnamed protein product [Rotaria sp. Silwood1]
MELSGLENIYAESSVDYPTISYEDITVKNPASILLPYDTTKIDKLKVEEDEISKSLSSTEAIKKNNFIVVDNNVVFRPGPRVIDAIKIIRSGTSTSANVTQANNLGTYNTGSKIGYNVGALIYTRLFDSFQFSTGLDFAGKNFEVTPPSNVNTGTPGANTRIDSTTQKVANNYMNIPLNFNFGGMVTDKLGFTFNGGPYLGILLSTDDKSGMGYKNFDFGLVGSLTANYKIAPLTSVLLGAKYEYGGLNNLGNTPYVDRVSTSSLGFFTGIRLAID